MTDPIRKILTPIKYVALAVLLSACASPKPAISVTDRLSAPYVEAQHQYHFAHASASLSHAERKKVHSFLSGLALRQEDAVFVTIPTSGSPVTDAGRKRTVAAALALVPARVSITMDENLGKRPLQPRQIGLIRVTRANGIKVECQPGIDDLGCANAINLAIMIDQPGDVLAPANTARTAKQ